MDYSLLLLVYKRPGKMNSNTIYPSIHAIESSTSEHR